MVSESMARKLFGRENPIGKPVYFSEFAGGIDRFSGVNGYQDDCR